MRFKCENCGLVFNRRIELIFHCSTKQCDKNIGLKVEPSHQEVPSDNSQQTKQNVSNLCYLTMFCETFSSTS